MERGGEGDRGHDHINTHTTPKSRALRTPLPPITYQHPYPSALYSHLQREDGDERGERAVVGDDEGVGVDAEGELGVVRDHEDLMKEGMIVCVEGS
jgi:hypothetical protein